MSGNVIQRNIIVSGCSQTGQGYGGQSVAAGSTIPSNNFYHNYVGSSIVTTGNGGMSSDTNPVQPGSLTGTPINCWAPTIAAGSQPTASPVSFPAGLVGGGGWGPPGFVIPQTGTAPSWPHTC